MTDNRLAFVSAIVPPAELVSESAWWFPIRGFDIVVEEASGNAAILRRGSIDEVALATRRPHFLGFLNDEPVYAVETYHEQPLPDGLGLRTLRSMFGHFGEQLFELAGRAMQIVEWDRTHQFCGRCGTPTEYVERERAKRCPACGQLSFPRLSPAVIVLVERGDEVLLARHTRTTDGMYAMLAGFVEPGESLEEAVRREIREETGVEVDRISYFGSQPWPFPHSLMIGFFAQHAGGEISVDGEEIADARWFRADAMPKVPPKLSIARKLIDAYAAKHGVTIQQP